MVTSSSFNFSQKSNNKVSFGGQRLYSLNLLKTLPNGAKEKVPAIFTELNDKTDFKFLESIENFWGTNTKYAQRIISHFKSEFNFTRPFPFRFSRFFLVECPQFKNPYERIRAISEVRYNIQPNTFKIRFLQSASEINSIEKLAGQGTNMLGGIVKQAMDNNLASINLISDKSCTQFYDKAGLKPLGVNLLGFNNNPCGYTIKKENYQEFLNKLKEKYGEILLVLKNES